MGIVIRTLRKKGNFMYRLKAEELQTKYSFIFADCIQKNLEGSQKVMIFVCWE